MALNKATGNMYEFITHTWNPIKGVCPHDCSYCYVKRIYARFKKELPAPYLDEKDLKIDLGYNRFIFIGSSIDMFASDIPSEYIDRVISKTCYYETNAYLLQTRNVKRIGSFLPVGNYTIGTTIETNRCQLADHVTFGPSVLARIHAMRRLKKRKLITIEPVMDFDTREFVHILRDINPARVAIGADSGHNGLPEPPKEKVLELISELEKFTTVIQKKNLKRIIGEAA